MKRAAVIAAFHIVLAAALSTIPSIWVYLLGKGWILGPGEMDLGADDLPPAAPAQVAFGLIISAVVWALLLALMVGVCVVAGDWVYLKDRSGFRRAVRAGCLATAWFVVWAAAIALGVTGGGGELIMPNRWPAGETFEVRQRLVYLLALFPVVWSAGTCPSVDRDRPAGRLISAGLCVALYWLAWAALWRALPWIAIEAYTG